MKHVMRLPSYGEWFPTLGQVFVGERYKPEVVIAMVESVEEHLEPKQKMSVKGDGLVQSEMVTFEADITGNVMKSGVQGYSLHNLRVYK